LFDSTQRGWPTLKEVQQSKAQQSTEQVIEPIHNTNSGRNMKQYYGGRNGGHVGGDLREAFCWYAETGEIPEEEYFSEYRGRLLNPGMLTGLLWNCTDIMPSETCAEFDLPRGSSYASGARIARAMLKDDDLAGRR
jgi:hypothetical protein